MNHGTIALMREATHLPTVLKSALLPLIEQCAQLGVELRVVADEDVPTLNVDRDKIAWAVSTLAGNALRYLVSAGATRTGSSILVHVMRVADGAVYIAVQDDGPGIPQERLEQLFVRGAKSAPSTALTLLLVRDIVAAHGGRIEVNSQSDVEEHFTCVTLLLPAGE